MKAIWKRIDQWLEKNAPSVQKDLKSGASEASIQQAEKKLGVKLPSAVIESVKIHDGQQGLTSPIKGEWQLLSLKNAVKQYEIMQKLLKKGDFDGSESKPDPQIKPGWWNPKWIPVLYNGAGDLYCLDFDPTDSGKAGQVIAVWSSSEKRELVAPDFKTLLETFADELEAGKYTVDGKKLVYKK